jgi:hypothetical protein
MAGNLAENGRERSHAKLRVRRYRDVVLTAQTRRQSQVTADLPRHHVTEGAQGARQVVSREVAGQPHAGLALRRDDFVADEMQPDDFGAITLVEMTAHGVTHRGAELSQVIGFRHDGGLDATGDEAALGGFRYDEHDFGHVAPPQAWVP